MKHDSAHVQRVGERIDWRRPGFWRITLRDRAFPRRPVFKRITPFWQRAA